jgi:HAD superfamily hydrolase (TIGR01509 family)
VQSRLRALVFDVDGTLADTEEAHRRAFNTAFRAHGLRWCWSPAQYAELLKVTGGKERIRAYIAQLPISGREYERLTDAVAAIHETKSQAYQKLVVRGDLGFRPGVLRLIKEARAAGMQLAIASTTSPGNVEMLITANCGAEALDWFTIAAGDVAKNKKPAPDIYLLVLSQLGLVPAQAMAFEDSMIGVKAAKAARLFTVAVPSAWTVGEDLTAADLTLASLGEPDSPLQGSDARQIGAAFLGLAELRVLHQASRSSSVPRCTD